MQVTFPEGLGINDPDRQLKPIMDLAMDPNLILNPFSWRP